MSDSGNRRLFLLDGMALAYRSHFAFIMNPIRNSKGQNTSAIFGFANTLLSILDLEQPTHLAACFDTSAPTKRHELYTDYKANRESMPEDLSMQIPEIIRMLEAFRIPILRQDGFEADDIIGTLTRVADEAQTYDTYMVSQDKDLGQLISPTCFLWKPGKRGADHEIIDLPKLLETWNIQRADQIIDILALMGDSSDNIPGIPGIGEKTAKALIEQFGSVEELLAHTDQLKGKRRETIEQNADKAVLSKELATIDRHIPLDVTLDDLCRQQSDEPALREFLQQYELRSIQARLFGKSAAPAKPSVPQDDLFYEGSEQPDDTPKPEPHANSSGQLELFEPVTLKDINSVKHDYTLVTAPADIKALAHRLEHAKEWCFDTETCGLDPRCDDLLGVSFCLEAHKAFYVPAASAADLEPFAKAFAGNALKIGHNLKFDLQVLRAHGIRAEGPFYDTMLAHALVAPGLRHGMDSLAESMLGYCTIKLADICPPGETKKSLNPRAAALEEMARYSCEDADITMQLYRILHKEVEQSGMSELFGRIELPLLPVLADMEYEGINVRVDKLQEASVKMEEYICHVRDKIQSQTTTPLNLNSPKQLGEFLFNELKLVDKPKKTKTGQFVTDEETLSTLAGKHEVVRDILAYREASKLKGTYLDALPRFISQKDGRIHTQFLQMLTATGRLASQDPNLQNIPIKTDQGRLIREAFVPRSDEYVLLSADYSQIELRIMAALSGDENMIDAFKHGRDIHTETASRVYGVARDEVDATMRRAAKMVNFGIIYRISAFGLSQRLGCPRGEAASLIDNYFTQFPGVRDYMDRLVADAEKTGYAATMCGRRRPLPDINSANRNIKSAAERTAINTPIQGSAAEMIKIAMVRVDELLKPTRSRLILQIHDELLVDLHRDEHHLADQVVEIMKQALPLPQGVPIIVEARTGVNWLEAH